MIFALWHGGANYAGSRIPRDVEIFSSLKAAGDALQSRAFRGFYWSQDFTFADGRKESNLTPCADAGAEMHVFLADPRDSDDPYPDRIITLGPRGGVRVERA